MNWTEHVSKPAAAQPSLAASLSAAAATEVVIPQVAEADAAFAAADEAIATVSYIGRHAAGATPAPRRTSTAPRIRPRQRVEVLSYA